MAELKPGSRWTSSVCDTEVIVVKGAGETDLQCGGIAMVAAGTDKAGGEVAAGADGGSQMGKRYVDAGDTIELLCTKAGAGSIGIGGTLLELKEAKPLPASD